jgi:c-di-GMP-binding flagellar brake protein YcgR
MTDIVRHITHSEDFTEHRKAARLDVPIKVEYRVLHLKGEGGAPQEEARGAVTKDVSAGGCLLLVTEDIPVDSEVELQIFLGDTESESLTLKGRVVRLNREERDIHEYGISFADMSKEARRLFADFCFAKMYEMIGLSEWPTDRRIKK